MDFILFVVLIIVIVLVVKRFLQMPEQRDVASVGLTNPSMICPHCQTRGNIHTK